MSTAPGGGKAKKGRMIGATSSFECPFCKKPHPMFMAKCPENGELIDKAFKMAGRVLESRFRVDRMIGRGGMGVVYEGMNVKISRKVAIKVLLSDTARSPSMLERFQNEARTAASVGHRNIVDILDMSESPDGLHYIVMEFLDGMDLGEVLKNAALRVSVAADFAVQILSALNAVHEHGIIHRDLKPENVIIVPEPGKGLKAKIVDFGLSRLGPPDSTSMKLTQTGTVFGTPRYMAPEQARGRKEIDHRADLYSMGVILYRMLTGALPFDAHNYNEQIIAITTEDPVPVGDHGVPIPDGLQDIVMRAIARDPEQRFQDATAFFEAIRPFRGWSDEGVVSPSTPPPQPLADFSGITRTPAPKVRKQSDSEPRSHVYSVVGKTGGQKMVDVVGKRKVKVLDELKLDDPDIAADVTPTPFRDSGASSYSVVNSGEINQVDVVDLSGSSKRSRRDTADSAEFALRAAMKAAAHKNPAAPKPSRASRQDAIGPWTFAEIMVEAEKVQDGIDAPDDSVSTVGWEGPATQSPKGRVPVWVVAAAFLVLAGAGVGTFFYLKSRSSASLSNPASLSLSKGGLPKGELVSPTAAAAPVQVEKKTRTWKVNLTGLPDGAEVFVDGALHPERPVIVENRSLPQKLRVVADDYEPWEKEVAVYSDISMKVILAKVEEVEEEETKVVKKVGKKGGKSEEESTSKIDTVYPGLGIPSP